MIGSFLLLNNFIISSGRHEHGLLSGPGLCLFVDRVSAHGDTRCRRWSPAALIPPQSCSSCRRTLEGSSSLQMDSGSTQTWDRSMASQAMSPSLSTTDRRSIINQMDETVQEHGGAPHQTWTERTDVFKRPDVLSPLQPQQDCLQPSPRQQCVHGTTCPLRRRFKGNKHVTNISPKCEVLLEVSDDGGLAASRQRASVWLMRRKCRHSSFIYSPIIIRKRRRAQQLRTDYVQQNSQLKLLWDFCLQRFCSQSLILFASITSTNIWS